MYILKMCIGTKSITKEDYYRAFGQYFIAKFFPGRFMAFQ